MKMKIGKVVLSVVALIGAFMPLAAGGNFFVNIHHIGGLSYLLYVVPVVLIALSIINIYKEIKYLKMWFISVSVIGLIIASLGAIAGINTVNAMNQQVLAFQERSQQFQDDFRKRQEDFKKEWDNFGKPNNERQDAKQEIETKQIQPQEKKATSQQPVSTPSAKPGTGAYLLAVGFVGIIILCLVPVQMLAVSVLATSLLFSFADYSFAVEKQQKKNSEKTASRKLPDAPTPFDLIFGQTNREEAYKILQGQGGTLETEGYRVIKDDISNPNIIGAFFRGVKIDGVMTTKAWFYKDTIMTLNYELSSSFKTFYDQLKERYGTPTKSRSGFGGEEYAIWKFKDVDLELVHPFMGTFTMSYTYIPLWGKSKQDDSTHYSETTKEKAKKQKGF